MYHFFVFCTHILLHICMHKKHTNQAQVMTNNSSKFNSKKLCGLNDKRMFQWWLIFKLVTSKKWLEVPCKHSQILFKSLCKEEQHCHCHVIPWCFLWESQSACVINYTISKMIKHSSLFLGLSWMYSKISSGVCTNLWQIHII